MTRLALVCAIGFVVSAWLFWVRPLLARRNAGREWVGRWQDKDARQRQCVGANKVHGPVVYYHHDATGEVVYVGKAVHFARRMRQEAHERMADDFHTWRAVSVPASRLLEVEAAEIDRLQPRHNRQGIRRREAA